LVTYFAVARRAFASCSTSVGDGVQLVAPRAVGAPERFAIPVDAPIETTATTTTPMHTVRRLIERLIFIRSSPFARYCQCLDGTRTRPEPHREGHPGWEQAIPI